MQEATVTFLSTDINSLLAADQCWPLPTCINKLYYIALPCRYMVCASSSRRISLPSSIN
jgi:hypothetical protein